MRNLLEHWFKGLGLRLQAFWFEGFCFLGGSEDLVLVSR